MLAAKPRITYHWVREVQPCPGLGIVAAIDILQIQNKKPALGTRKCQSHACGRARHNLPPASRSIIAAIDISKTIASHSPHSLNPWVAQEESPFTTLEEKKARRSAESTVLRNWYRYGRRAASQRRSRQPQGSSADLRTLSGRSLSGLGYVLKQ